MGQRSQEWLAEFGHIAEEQSEDVKLLILDGSIEVCPVCLELSAYAFQDTTAYDEDEDAEPSEGTIALVGASSGYEWTCGHCKSHVAEASSPINHPCYTHEDD